MTTPRQCPKCGNEPVAPGQRLGRACFNAYRRAWRARKAAAGAIPAAVFPPGKPPRENRRPAPGADDPRWPAFAPFAEATTPPREPWYSDYLAHLAVNGGKALAAAHVGISETTVDRATATDPTFRGELEAAQRFYRDLLEWESVNLARTRRNPLPFFARLKAELPHRYLDRSAVLSLTVQPDAPPTEEARALLRAMLGAARPETLRMLQAEPGIIEASGASLASAEEKPQQPS